MYGFLAILFKNLEDLNPDYIAVSFDLKAKTKRHKMYEAYKANRHGMPDELAQQMPIIKEVLRAMNIDIVELEGFEGDDILGTLSNIGESQGLDVTILSGDRDTFQLATDKVTIRIPRTKQGKTETDEYDKNKVIEEYGLEPKDLIEVKGLQGDSSDNIPGVPGIGPKTAISLIQKYGTIENLYKEIEEGKDDLKGKTRETIIENKEMAFLSKELGKIDKEVPIDNDIENLKVQEWDKKKVLEIFKSLNFNRFIERFGLISIQEEKTEVDNYDLFKIVNEVNLKNIEDLIKKQGKLYFFLGLKENDNNQNIIKKEISSISFYDYEKKETYFISNEKGDFKDFLKNIFEDETIEKYSTNLGNCYILLKQIGITMKNIKYDIEVASYILDPTVGKYPLEDVIKQYLNINIDNYLKQNGISDNKEGQITLFDSKENDENIEMYKISFYAYCIYELSKKLSENLTAINAMDLFNKIDMPTVEVLADMQFNGMKVNEDALDEFGKELKKGLDVLTGEIYELAGEEFNINSPKQLGEVLFEKMGLPIKKKTKSGYSTAEDVLEKLRYESPIIEKILEYRQLAKLNSTYVEGMKPFINPKTKRIHSFFHQTITATRKNKFDRTKSSKYSN